MEYKNRVNSILKKYQHNFPLLERPFLEIAKNENLTEVEVQNIFLRMKDEEIISRVGPIFHPKKVGSSFLAAIKCPVERIDEVANIINSFTEVNHNYLRENELNLWFVMTGKSMEHLDLVVKDLEEKTDLIVFKFPMIKSFKIDLSLKEEVKW